MSAVDLIALAERVERLTGPDRGVDAAIAEAAGWTRENIWREPNWRTGPTGLEDWAAPGFCAAQRLPRYTASLDSAMTLVPEGSCWRTARFPRGEAVAAALVEGGPEVMANTPALALIAAALRARAALNGSPS